MKKFTVSFDVTTETSVEPKWILESIGDQLETAEWINEYVCKPISEFTFNVSFNIGSNYSSIDWIIDTVDKQLNENETITNVSIK